MIVKVHYYLDSMSVTAQLEVTFYDNNTVINQVVSPLSIGELMIVGIDFANSGNIPGSVFGMYQTECTIHGTTQSTIESIVSNYGS